MNAQALLSRFDLIVDVPGNIQHLRKLVIQLAISGRLIDTLSDDSSPSELLKRLRLKRHDLTDPRLAKRRRLLPPIDEAELPRGCHDVNRFERLEHIALLEKGLTAIQSAKPGVYPLVVTAEERSSCDHYDFNGCAAVIPMVSSTGHGSATLKRLHYQEGKFALGNILCAAFPLSDDLISARFIFEYLTAFKEELLVSKMIGTANVSLTLGKIGAIPIPIVLPTVQRRVDELMALCDQLEESQKERETRRHKLALSSLHYLNNVVDPNTAHEQSTFYLNNLSRLTARTEHIHQLRNTLLDLAVRGRLLHPDNRDEPATELLKRIQAEQEKLAKKGTIPRQKWTTSKDEIELAFSPPKTWEAVHFGSLCNLVTSGSRGWAEYYAKSGPKFIRAQNIRFGKLLLDDLASVSLPKNTEGTRTQVSTGDLLIVITGAGVTNPALLNEELGEAYVSQHVALIKPTSTDLSRWLLLCLMAPSGGRAELVERAYGAGKPGLNLDNIRSLPIPIPPLAEQQRIVAKVDELMALCDCLEEHLHETETGSRRLLEAVINAALNRDQAPNTRAEVSNG